MPYYCRLCGYENDDKVKVFEHISKGHLRELERYHKTDIAGVINNYYIRQKPKEVLG